ncbi:WPP domain-interacting tail-anchored protein 1-like [Typha latifolia]|uniref:WPP domain-interacting tail-anchored protein 1-like n=1 Tax=Typha latifolia TaxID=4733 RepID=UPI003C302BAE
MGSDDQDNSYCQEEMPSNGERTTRGGSPMEVLTRVELDLAYSSEKLLNLDILLMEVAGRGTEFDALALGNGDVSSASVVKAFEFDILSGILDSEVKELDNFMTYLQKEIVDACQKVTDDDHIEESSSKIEEKLHDAEVSLKQSQDLVADIRKQSAKIEKVLDSGWNKSWSNGDGGVQNGHFSSNNTKWTLQNADQRRHVLQMLEKSLARELDLEKKLSDSRSAEEELKLKLCHAEQETYCLEESLHMIAGRLFETEIAADVLLAISKELTGILNFVQCNPSAFIHQELEMQPELGDSVAKLSAEESALEKLKTSCAALDNIISWQENGLKDSLAESANECMLAALRDKVLALEERLRESDIRLQLEKASTEASQEQQSMLHSELSALENVIEVLKENVLKTEGRAERAEAKCTRLTKTNMELNEELGVLRNSGSDRANLLERKLKESDTQIEHAKASVDAIAEQQNILSATMIDMEHVIGDFKEKVSKAESRALSAEVKCTLLTETNFELNEELGFLRSRVECLETSLHEYDDAKVSAAKDIGIRSNVIADLVMKLALERERLHIQVGFHCIISVFPFFIFFSL